MYEKTSKSVNKSHKKTVNNKSASPEHAQGFVALKDCNSKKYILHDLYDSWDHHDNTKESTEEYMRRSVDGRTMTRTTRSRQPRLHTAALQSGYCAICHLHYNSLEDHIQSKKHLKLIGDDANFISLNGFLDQDASFGAFLDFNGIGISLSNKTLDCDYSPNPKTKRSTTKMPRTRAVSVCGRRIKEAPPSPTRSEAGHHVRSPTRSEKGHHLRSRKQINYASPTTEEDSLPEMPEKPEKKAKEVVVSRVSHGRPRRHINYNNSIIEDDNSLSEQPERDNRELRSSSRIFAKLADQDYEEVWTSGRPKRSSCIRQKRSSPDERLVSDNKSYYKVEVLTTKLRSSGSCNKDTDTSKKRSRSPATYTANHKLDEKGLIVKFKKLRNSELVQLNNEAENFLFPKKDDGSSEEDLDDEDNTTTTTEKNDNSSVASEFDEPRSPKFKVEDEASMDSVSSDAKRKKRRRTHAEAFIMDNQKYYKFETPGSSSCRLRYQGSFLPAVTTIKSPKHNGDCAVKSEKHEVEVEEERKSTFNVDDYQFSFERKPKNEPWYQTFARQDRGEESYIYFNDEAFWNPFLLPYQIGPLPPIDPKICITQYKQVKKFLLDPPSTSTSGGTTTPEPSASASTLSSFEPEEDEDSKISANDCESEESRLEQAKKLTRGQKTPVGKNPRKSPRQHASTLAILSSLIQQRKRRSKNQANALKANLSPIPEEHSKNISEQQAKSSEEKVEKEEKVVTEEVVGEEKDQSKLVSPPQTPVKVRKKPGRRPRIDYKAIAHSINEELMSLDPELEDIQLEISEENDVLRSKTNVLEVLRLYDESKAREGSRFVRKFFNGGVPGRKPGRKKKANKTGWPNRIRRMMRKEQPAKDDQDDNSTIDSVSVNADSEDNELCEDTNSTDSISKKIVNNCVEPETVNKFSIKKKISSKSNGDNINTDRVKSKIVCRQKQGSDLKRDSVEKVLKVNNNKVTNKSILQPYVRVQKLGCDQIDKNLRLRNNSGSPKRTNMHQRRMPASPKSPRMLRKPRGRWYRER